LAEGTQIARGGATPEAFARFLAWLDPEPGRAAAEYERLRRRIARFFAYRGCPDADTLADEVFDRVVGKMGVLDQAYSGECARYLYGVARNVYLESVRRQARFQEAVRSAPRAAGPADRERGEREQDCLDRCLATLGDAERALVTAYYQTDPAGRPAKRRALAGQEGLSAENLRQRSHRLRERLRACLRRCLEGSESCHGGTGGGIPVQGEAAPAARRPERE
jgi:RNA polymerase sigma factor (sigma-70 family)